MDSIFGGSAAPRWGAHAARHSARRTAAVNGVEALRHGAAIRGDSEQKTYDAGAGRPGPSYASPRSGHLHGCKMPGRKITTSAWLGKGACRTGLVVGAVLRPPEKRRRARPFDRQSTPTCAAGCRSSRELESMVKKVQKARSRSARASSCLVDRCDAAGIADGMAIQRRGRRARSARGTHHARRKRRGSLESSGKNRVDMRQRAESSANNGAIVARPNTLRRGEC
ncbi:hypothetical protein FA95DRAFT_1194761 [Auriscalpium vulgare]|uniref:Uncharacterized protein n=1 Tax=Auriscalpium vulgare TaxID=40419 RepID=A0ACB8R407_9AGAM|nr:hypothetical protein FA95DRAFT_1194761 [Auriscalpium vulgare]